MQYLVENTDKVFDDELNKFVDCKDYSKVIGFFSPDFKSPLSKEALSLAKLLTLLNTESISGVARKAGSLCIMRKTLSYASSSDLTYGDLIINIYDDILQNLDRLQIHHGNILIFVENSVYYTFKIKDKDKLSIFLTKYRVRHKIKQNKFKEIFETL